MKACEVSIQFILDSTGFTLEQVALVTGVSLRTVNHWIGHGTSVLDHCLPKNRELLGALAQLSSLGQDQFVGDGFKSWLNLPNRHFKGRMPRDVVLQDGSAEVVNVLDMLASGGSY